MMSNTDVKAPTLGWAWSTYLRLGMRHLLEVGHESPTWGQAWSTYMTLGMRHLHEAWYEAPTWGWAWSTCLRLGMKYLLEAGNGHRTYLRLGMRHLLETRHEDGCVSRSRLGLHGCFLPFVPTVNQSTNAKIIFVLFESEKHSLC